MAGFGGLISGIGGAVADMYAAEGDKINAEGYWQAAAKYGAAAHQEDVNVSIEKLSNQLQQKQLDRKITKVEGTQTAVEGAGNVSGGSAGDILRETIGQGALAKTVVNTQSAIEENKFKLQKIGYEAQQVQAEATSNAYSKAAQGAQMAGMFSILGGVMGMMG